jgi:hypothetical protein
MTAFVDGTAVEIVMEGGAVVLAVVFVVWAPLAVLQLFRKVIR